MEWNELKDLKEWSFAFDQVESFPGSGEQLSYGPHMSGHLIWTFSTVKYPKGKKARLVAEADQATKKRKCNAVVNGSGDDRLPEGCFVRFNVVTAQAAKKIYRALDPDELEYTEINNGGKKKDNKRLESVVLCGPGVKPSDENVYINTQV